MKIAECKQKDNINGQGYNILNYIDHTIAMKHKLQSIRAQIIKLSADNFPYFTFIIFQLVDEDYLYWMQLNLMGFPLS